MAEGDTLVNALIGAVVGLVLSFLPLSPMLGGAIAGYLEGGDREDGVRVGSIAGVIVFLPLVGFGVLLFGFGAFFLLGGFPGAAGGVVIVFLVLFGLVVVGLYTVGLSALGGWLGNYVRYDTDLGNRD